MSTTPHIAAAPNATDPNQIPPEIRGWNWGAFLLSWIWGVGNNTFIALIAIIPGVGLIMRFVLGAKGNRWAWRNGRWDSVEHFKRVQRKWAMWGAIIWVAAIVLFGGFFFGVFSLLKHSEAYHLGVSNLQSSPVAASVLGTPITAGNPSGSISTENQNGKASLSFTVSGPKGSGTAFVEAIKKDGVWTLTRLALKPDGSDSVIEIVGAGARRNST